MTVNRYTKLIKTLKESPTNSMGGVYSLNPPGFRVGKKDRESKFFPDVDGNFTDGIPGNPGDPYYLRPEGYWDGGNQWSEEEVPDASQNYLEGDPTGKSTTDLISEDGTVKTFLPPNSRHFILGPLVSGYVYNHGYDNYTNIGYIQKDTRQFVLLARIDGQFTEGLEPQGGRVWNGTQLTPINNNFTIEMATWFKDQITAGTITNNVPYFYSGGVPQQELTVLQCPNCPPNMFGGITPGTVPGGGFGTGTPPSLGSLQGPPQSGDQVKINYFNLSPEQVTTLAILLGLGLTIAAVVAVLFPEPTSSAAGATYLAGKFRFAASLKRALGNIWKTKPKTYKKIEYPKPQPPKPKEIRFDPTKPGGGQEWQNAARNWQRQNPGKYNPYRSDSANQLMKKYDVGKDIMNSYDHITDVKQKLILETFEKALLNEAAPTGSGPGGGTGIADAYVNDMADKYDANDLQKASDDANDIAGDQGLDDKQKSDIDREAERRARELNNVNYSRPESMTGDQIDNFYDMAFSVDEEWLDQAYDTYQNLIPLKEIDKAYDEYKEQREYLYTTEWTRTVSSEYNSLSDIADQKWQYVRHLTFPKTNMRSDGTYSWHAYYKGVKVENYEDGWGRLHDWVKYYREANKIYDNVIAPERERQREKLTQDLMKRYRTLYRPFDMAMIRAWSQRNINDDPYSLEDLFPNADLSNMSKAEKKRLLKLMQKLGVDYGEVAALPALALPIIAAPAFKAALAGGMIALTAYLQKKGVGPQLINQIATAMGAGDAKDLDPTGELGVEDDFSDSKEREIPPLSDKENMAGRHAKEKADADKALQDAIDQHGADSDEAVEARQRRNDVYTRHKREKKSVKESYKPKFRRNRQPLTERKNPNQKRILREIRKPVSIKEAPSKYKINFSNQNTASSQTDELVMRANARGQQWKSDNKRWSGYETTEKDNIMQDRIGHGKQAFDYMIEQGTQKSEWRTREVQEELNKIAHEKAMLKENPDFKSPFGEVEVSTTEVHDDNFNKVSKKIKQIASKDKEVKPEYPDDGDALQKKDMLNTFQKLKKEFEHEKLNSGERASAYYKRLDPTSAKSMPDAAYPQIDAFKDQARKKPK